MTYRSSFQPEVDDLAMRIQFSSAAKEGDKKSSLVSTSRYCRLKKKVPSLRKRDSQERQNLEFADDKAGRETKSIQRGTLRV